MSHRQPLIWFYVTYVEDDYLSLLMAVVNQTPYFVLSILAFQIILTLWLLYHNRNQPNVPFRAWFWDTSLSRLNIWLSQLFVGILLNEFIASQLKAFLMDERPSSGLIDRQGEGGMPSSHAQFAAFLAHIVTSEAPKSRFTLGATLLFSFIVTFSRYSNPLHFPIMQVHL
jgi:membrane-associated phospholipid phosphatase